MHIYKHLWRIHKNIFIYKYFIFYNTFVFYFVKYTVFFNRMVLTRVNPFPAISDLSETLLQVQDFSVCSPMACTINSKGVLYAVLCNTV